MIGPNKSHAESEKNKSFSQYGEDEIIKELFVKIGTRSKFLAECGAANGVKNSSSRNLLAEQGWSGLLIEADLTEFDKLKVAYEGLERVTCINRFISFEGADKIDEIFAAHNVPSDLDLFILDIDGNEYHVWESMQQVRPSLMIVEFNPTIPNEVDFVQPKDMSIQQGSSLRALQRLGKEKGYRLVALTEVNAFFVRNDLAGPFSAVSDNLDTLRPVNSFETKVFQLYDGTLKISGYSRLFWNNIPIDEEKIQVLSPSKRIYLNGINSRSWVRGLKYWVRKSPLYPLVKAVRKIALFRAIIK